MKQLEKLLLNLISINSTNPDYSDKSVGEKEIVDFVYEYFRKHNIDCIKQEVINKRKNIVAKIDGNKNKETILFCSHLDTVYIDGMKFNPKIIDGKIYGPGSCDAKASVAAMINTFINIKDINHEKPNIYFAGVIGEEFMHIGIKKFISEFKNFDSAIIGEPTNLNIGIAHKGYIRFRIKTKGKSTHGSTPEHGINAIYSMEKLINKIRTKLIPKYKNLNHRILGNPTVNIGKIAGGVSFNIVPDYCIIYIDRRTILGENHNGVINEFKDLIEEIKVEDNTFDADIEDILQSAPSLETNVEKKIVKVAYKSCKKIMKDFEIMCMPFTTDGGFLSNLNIPTIILGPGNIKDCHKLGEFVSLNQLIYSSEIYKDIILSY